MGFGDIEALPGNRFGVQQRTPRVSGPTIRAVQTHRAARPTCPRTTSATGNRATPATTAPARVEYGDPARLIGLMLAQGSATVGLMVAVVGLVIMRHGSAR